MPYKASATMTSKGQVTVPADIRAKLGVKAGDRLDFHLAESGKLTVTAVRRRSIFDGIEDLELPALGRSLTKTDIDAAVGEAMTEQDLRIRNQK